MGYMNLYWVVQRSRYRQKECDTSPHEYPKARMFVYVVIYTREDRLCNSLVTAGDSTSARRDKACPSGLALTCGLARRAIHRRPP